MARASRVGRAERRAEGTLEVGDKVRRVLQSNGDPEEARSDPGLGQLVQHRREAAGRVLHLDTQDLREVRREAGLVQQRAAALGVGEDETDDADCFHAPSVQ